MTIGTVLSGRYVVEEVVGTGGMAVVYRAFDRKKKHIVAVKVLRAEFQNDEEFLRRFSREAEAASKVSHENIVGMLDVGVDGDTRYIVMEFVDGTTLKDMIRQMGHLRADAVVRMGIRILAAVDHAHKNGIVHRDIKPQNILVNSQGKVKVADFGIARLKAQQTTRVADVNSSALGSVHYISPEQASGEVADEKSDLYSVGVVLYEMLTGQVPFDGDTAVSVALKHVSEEPRSMREIDPSISKALDEVVLRALRKRPEERYQTAAEMAGDLRKALVKPGKSPSKGWGFRRAKKKETPKKEPSKAESKPLDPRQRRERFKRKLRYALWGVGIACVLFGVVMGMWIWSHVRVPNVCGMNADEAYSKLEGFDVVFNREYNSFAAVDTVIAQSPKSGKFVARDARVVVTVSDGNREVTVSDYTGYAVGDAMRELAALGMNDVTVEYVMDDAPVDTVVGQDPAQGAAQRDQGMVLKVSGETELVPSVWGMTLEDARAAIEGANLAVGNVSEAYSADAAAGTVIAQSAAKDSELLKGASIDLTIAQSQEIMYYPDSDFRVVVPLDNTHVIIALTAPSGAQSECDCGVMNLGTHSVPLSSTESGVHSVSVYLDSVLTETISLMFE